MRERLSQSQRRCYAASADTRATSLVEWGGIYLLAFALIGYCAGIYFRADTQNILVNAFLCLFRCHSVSLKPQLTVNPLVD